MVVVVVMQPAAVRAQDLHRSDAAGESHVATHRVCRPPERQRLCFLQRKQQASEAFVDDGCSQAAMNNPWEAAHISPQADDSKEAAALGVVVASHVVDYAL
jgi:hypothetical protein